MQNTTLDIIKKLNATVLSHLKFYMNKKHIDHRGVNNDVQTKHENISLVACKSMFRSTTHTHNNENINIVITHVIHIFCERYYAKQQIKHIPLIFGAYNYKSWHSNGKLIYTFFYLPCAIFVPYG